ncbi:MAG: hypothetical protein ACLTZT_18510 [Butyricimonas faecalis]
MLEEQRAVIAYDLSEAGIEQATRFILKREKSCLVGSISDTVFTQELCGIYWNGTVDERIRKDVFHPDVAEILRSKMARAVGACWD